MWGQRHWPLVGCAAARAALPPLVAKENQGRTPSHAGVVVGVVKRAGIRGLTPSHTRPSLH